jgi:hypothetical protein
MSQKNNDKIVKDFLKNIKEKLPEWLKEKKDELNDVLSEIEEHIWDKAEELSDIETPTEASIRLALAHMGTPESIAREYKRRGTPKVYITEELWPLYTKVLGILSAVVVMVNVVFMIINIAMGNFQLDFIGIILGLAVIFTVVTLIFVGLSMEGFLPEDFKTEEERKREDKELSIAERKGWPISPNTGKSLKPFIHPTSIIVGGIIQMAFGLILIIQPNTDFTHLIEPEFLVLLRFFGVFIISEGCLNLIRGVIGNQLITRHQIIISIKIFLSIMTISLLVVLVEQPELVPFVPFEKHLISWFFAFIILMVIIGAISETYKAVTLEKYRNINL